MRKLIVLLFMGCIGQDANDVGIFQVEPIVVTDIEEMGLMWVCRCTGYRTLEATSEVCAPNESLAKEFTNIACDFDFNPKLCSCFVPNINHQCQPVDTCNL